MTSRHPRGLYTLFFTEMWERASFYGMRALLVLFLTAPLATGGMELSDRHATAIYGLYTAAVYVFSMPGAWVTDRLLGLKNAVFYGGIIITLGHFCLAFPSAAAFYFGLVLIVLGTGLLKPAASTLVGELYTKNDDAGRDAAYSIYYMGINLGAIIGPFVCGFLGENINWHYGFAAAGIGMMLGVVQFGLSSRKHLGLVGNIPVSRERKDMRLAFTGGLLLTLFLCAVFTGLITLNPITLITKASVTLFVLTLVIIAYIYRSGISGQEQNHLKAALVLFLAGSLFWAGFEQAGSSFNLFAERYTNRQIDAFEMPASWLLSVNSMFIILLAPFFASLWIRLGMKGLNPSAPVKFGLSLIQVGLGFGVMAWAASFAVTGEKVLPTWLILTYLLHTTAELCLSPIALSIASKLAPPRFKTQMMGVWFLFIALGNLLAGILAGWLGEADLTHMPVIFAKLLAMLAMAGFLLIALRKPIARWMA